MSKERLKETLKRATETESEQLNEIKKKNFSEYTLEDYVFLHEQAKQKQKLESVIETLSVRLNDLTKEVHILKNYQKINVDHPSNKYF